MKYLNLFFTKRCNLLCYRGRDGYSCIAGRQRPSADLVTEPAIADIVGWIDSYATKSPVHITGGEPCIREDLTELIAELLNAGHKVSLDTNGLLLKNHSLLKSMDIAYHVTWHRSQVTKSEFISALSGFDTSKMLVSSVIPRDMNPPFDLESELKIGAWGYKWIVDRVGYLGEKAAPRTGRPNKTMIFIGQNGAIHPCSKPSEVYGNIKDDSFDAITAFKYKCPENLFPQKCYALRTAELMCEINGIEL